jgi:DNA-binding HxlR family transcriptional regulator
MASVNQRIKQIQPNEGCITKAMRVLGLKWSALILRDLNSGPKHFCELEHSITKITPRILSQRLNDLESQKIIIQTDGSYKLTKKGADLIPTLVQMADWGSKYPD